MNSRRTGNVPMEDVIFPDCFTAIRGARRFSQACHQCSQVLPGLSSAVSDLLSAHQGASRLEVGTLRVVVGAPK